MTVIGNYQIDVKKFLDGVDLNKNNKLNYSEFLTAFYSFEENVKKQEIQKIFHLIDADKSGYISKKELGQFFLMEEDEELLEEIFSIADKNKDNRISQEEFYRAVENCF